MEVISKSRLGELNQSFGQFDPAKEVTDRLVSVGIGLPRKQKQKHRSYIFLGEQFLIRALIDKVVGGSSSGRFNDMKKKMMTERVVEGYKKQFLITKETVFFFNLEKVNSCSERISLVAKLLFKLVLELH